MLIDQFSYVSISCFTYHLGTRRRKGDSTNMRSQDVRRMW